MEFFSMLNKNFKREIAFGFHGKVMLSTTTKAAPGSLKSQCGVNYFQCKDFFMQTKMFNGCLVGSGVR